MATCLAHPETLGEELRRLAEDDPTVHDLAALDQSLVETSRKQANLAEAVARADDPDVREVLLSMSP